jgi:hypothetical protein
MRTGGMGVSSMCDSGAGSKTRSRWGEIADQRGEQVYTSDNQARHDGGASVERGVE